MRPTISMLAELLPKGIDRAVIAPGSNGLTRIAGLGAHDYREDVAYVGSLEDVLAQSASSIPDNIVVSVPVGTSFQDAAEYLRPACSGLLVVAQNESDRLIEIVGDALARYDDWERRMLFAVAEGRTLGDVLAIGAELLANPVALIGPDATLIARAGNITVDESGQMWKTVLARGISPNEIYTESERKAYVKSLSQGESYHLVRPERDINHMHLSVPLVIDGRSFGALGQVDLNASFTAGQIGLACAIRDVLLARAKIELDRNQGTALEQCMRTVLEGVSTESSAVRFQLGRIGWSADDTYRMLLCPFPTEGGENLIGAPYKMMMKRALPKSLCMSYSGDIICIFRSADYDINARSFCDTVTAETSKYNLTCGLSDEFTGIGEAGRAWSQCAAAIEEGIRQDRKGIVVYADIAVGQTIRQIRESGASRLLMDQHLETLIRRSAEPRDAVQTVFQYLLCGQNAAKAAKVLFLHRNTLGYRMSQIENVMGVQFADLDDSGIIRLMISCLIYLLEK